jgi:uncharacterized metal-binding protein YceD (DUF177 family)
MTSTINGSTCPTIANFGIWKLLQGRILSRMNSHLVIDLAMLPEEGGSFSGDLAAEIFDLPADDAQPAGPLSYNLYAQRFETELLLTGTLAAPFRFTCVRCLEHFVQTINLPGTAISLEITGPAEIDATEALREEVLINFPAHPRCDQSDVPVVCEIDPAYLAVDKQQPDTLDNAAPSGGDDRWSALDALDNLENER